MRAIRSLAAFAAAALIAVAYAQGSALAPQSPSEAAQQPLPDIIAYAAFQSDVSDLGSMQLASAADIDSALDLAARHDRDALVRGWMSYAADVAAQSPPFVEGVREAEHRWGRDTVARITSNRSFARQLPGSADAIHRVLDALASDAARVAGVAERHRGFAYSLQSDLWGSAMVVKLDERLQRIRALGQPGGFTPVIPISAAGRLTTGLSSISPDAGDTAIGGRRFWDAVDDNSPVLEAGSPPFGHQPARWREDEARPDTLNAILSVAALRVLGAQRTQAGAISYFLSDPRAVGCVEMAQLQFYSCLSATRFVYENEHCLAQHGLRDVAMCISEPILHDETYMAAFAAPPANFAELAEVAAVNIAPIAAPQAGPAPEPMPVSEAVEQAEVASLPGTEVASLPGTAEAPTASPIVSVEPLPPLVTAVAAPVTGALAAAPTANVGATASFGEMGVGELFARADELDEQGQAAQARMVRRSLIARFPESPLALLAAQRLAGAPSTGRQN